ncbi:hypothetical protein ABIB82_007487 [Bradyrhizobium sp. i1.8.4]
MSTAHPVEVVLAWNVGRPASLAFGRRTWVFGAVTLANVARLASDGY